MAWDAVEVAPSGGKAGDRDALELGPGLAQPVGAAGGAGDDLGGELKAAFGSWVSQQSEALSSWIFENVRGAEHLNDLIDMDTAEGLEHFWRDVLKTRR